MIFYTLKNRFNLVIFFIEELYVNIIFLENFNIKRLIIITVFTS
jgi:hypothetical protein